MGTWLLGNTKETIVMNQSRTKSAACFRLLAGFALGGVLLLAPRAFAAESQAPVDTKDKDIAAAKDFYAKKADKLHLKYDEAKKTAFAECWYGCRNGKAAKGALDCYKQCGPELFPAETPPAPAAK